MLTNLGVRLDPKLSLKTYFDDIVEKVSRRLNLLKRLASSNWGTNKNTLRQLYSGYVRAVFLTSLLLCKQRQASPIRASLTAYKTKV